MGIITLELHRLKGIQKHGITRRITQNYRGMHEITSDYSRRHK